MAICAHRLVGKHDVQFMHGEALEQVIDAAGFQRDAQIVTTEKGSQQVFLEVPRQRSHRTNTQYPAGLPAALQCGLQFAAKGKDVFGVIKHQLACFGELQAPPGAQEECMAQLIFQRADLGRQG